MAFCSNCGHSLNDGANFCANCGASVCFDVNAQENNNSRRIINDGELHKCPNCGELLNSFVSCCPFCGYELRDTASVSAIIDFASKIETIESEEYRIRLIKSFTIPNTKEDIIEVMILTATNACSDNASDEITNAWLVKLEQCYQKANFLLSNDSDFHKIQSIYANTHKQIRRNNRKRKRKATNQTNYISRPARTISGFGAFLRIIPRTLGMIAGIVVLYYAVKVNQSGDNSVGYQIIGSMLLFVSVCMLWTRNVSYFEIFVGAIGGIFSLVFAKKLDNGAFLKIVGVQVLIMVVITYFVTLGRKES